jgi:DNA repair protein RadC
VSAPAPPSPVPPSPVPPSPVPPSPVPGAPVSALPVTTTPTPDEPRGAPASWRQGAGGGTLDSIIPPCPSCEPTTFHVGGAERPEVTSPEAAAALLVPPLHGRDRERCVAALLDTKHRLLDVATVSVGSIDHTFMAPREVFRDALLANASALVLAHNHPSGDPEPSRDDELVTRRLVRAGELVGVEVLDHLVVGGRRWVSLARRGVL